MVDKLVSKIEDPTPMPLATAEGVPTVDRAAEANIRVIREATSAMADPTSPQKPVDANESALSPENRELLNGLRLQLVAFIDDLKKVGLEFRGDIEKLMKILEDLGNPTLDFVRTDFAQPEVIVDTGQDLWSLRHAINRHLYSHSQMAVYANPDDPAWKYDDAGEEKAGVFIIEGKGEMDADTSATSKEGIEIHDPKAQQYVLWAAVQKFVKNRRVDGDTYTLLKKGEDGSVVPTGITNSEGVSLIKCQKGASDLFRRRRVVGGYVG